MIVDNNEKCIEKKINTEMNNYITRKRRQNTATMKQMTKYENTKKITWIIYILGY